MDKTAEERIAALEADVTSLREGLEMLRARVIAQANADLYQRQQQEAGDPSFLGGMLGI